MYDFIGYCNNPKKNRFYVKEVAKDEEIISKEAARRKKHDQASRLKARMIQQIQEKEHSDSQSRSGRATPDQVTVQVDITEPSTFSKKRPST